jgi:hypothetical protein
VGSPRQRVGSGSHETGLLGGKPLEAGHDPPDGGGVAGRCSGVECGGPELGCLFVLATWSEDATEHTRSL